MDRFRQFNIKRKFLPVVFAFISIVLVVLAFKLQIHKTIEIEAKSGGVYLLDSIYSDVHIIVKCKNKLKKPFIIKGKSYSTKLLGNSFLKIEANNVIVENLSFENNVIDGKDCQALVYAGNLKKVFEDITIKNCQFKYLKKFIDKDISTQFFWIRVSAHNTTINNCIFEGKQNRLPIIHVDSKYKKVIIKNSQFKNVPVRSGEALEAIRIGLVDGSTDAVIKNNEFINYHGDSETISCKSSGVNIFCNKFISSRSGVSIRYANNCIVKNNYFENVNTAVRIAGENHKVNDNNFKKCNKNIVLMIGGENYPAVKNLEITRNNFSNDFFLELLFTKNQTILPTKVIMKNNFCSKELKTKKIKNSKFYSNDFEKSKMILLEKRADSTMIYQKRQTI